MYHGGSRRSPEGNNDRKWKEYQTHSPTHAHPYSPSNGTYPHSPYNQYASLPPNSSTMTAPPVRSPRATPLRSPKMNGSSLPAPVLAPPNPTSTRYDPLSEHREGSSTRKHQYEVRSPTQTRDTLPAFKSYSPEAQNTSASYRSPTETRFQHSSPTMTTSHAHPTSGSAVRQSSPPKNSPTQPNQSSSNLNTLLTKANGHVDVLSSQGTIDEEPSRSPVISRGEQAPERAPVSRANPMDFSNILSGDAPEPPKPTPRTTPAPKASKSTSNHPNGDVKPASSVPRKSVAKASTTKASHASTKTSSKLDPDTPASLRGTSTNKRKLAASAEKESQRVKAEMAKIDAMELSDLDSPSYQDVKENYQNLKRKRQVDVADGENVKRKRRRAAFGRHLAAQLGVQADAGRERFRELHEQDALAEVQQKEIHDEKERKKDMQRKRRREKTIQQQTQLQKEAISAANNAADQAEKEKHLKEAQKAAKKVVTTQRILERADAPEGIREVTPLAPNLEGGIMTAFQSANKASPEPARKKVKGVTTRPKKSKEKKRAEKESAEAGFAAMQRDELVAIAPKEQKGKETVAKEIKETKPPKEEIRRDSSPATAQAIMTNYSSKGYNQIYEQIWKDIARKDIPKVCRVKDNSMSTKQSNLRKTAQLAAKEARRWQLRTNKGTKDVQARAKRSMREMMTFWKRNERTERDLRKNAEKQELENAKKAEAEREANRQKRKLNFLISQTELYSHFISSKIKTDEIERSTDSPDVAMSTEKVQAGKASAHTVTLPPADVEIGTKVTNFEDLDFDAEDDSALHMAAMANAQSAVQEAQNRARAFNQSGEEVQSRFDEGDMNFQNPTGLGDVNIGQPKMLAAQLKEYQLTGLNWLAGLYDKGINGILADEMGLGKTVQSISVMAYLAEAYNIWGPFLVVAPASTLHNWQQEITRFVPNLKCLPYWGSAKDRKVLRKFWDRKHITYTKDSPFHVLVTSYQLVVHDTQYFQKVKWQYMILDEAQAIKSSQSSRWKSLLNFQCRNRLLLTGTPIQNNMQELWALLHFIMPSLFDSHDEFSDWFSKDIENHAQSNSKLNEDQLMRLHTILKPFMLRRVKKNVQKELGDKIEEDVFCDLTYRQRAYYSNLRNKISIMDLIEKAAVGDDQDTATLMNLVMQFRKVCNHPDLFERSETTSPLSLVHFAETASFLREGSNVNVSYSTRNLIEYELPRLLCGPEGMIEVAGPNNRRAGFQGHYLAQLMNIYTPENISRSISGQSSFSWLRFADVSAGEVYFMAHHGPAERAIKLQHIQRQRLGRLKVLYDEGEDDGFAPSQALFKIVERNDPQPLAEVTAENRLHTLMNVARTQFEAQGLGLIEACSPPGASAPPIQIACSNQQVCYDRENTMFNIPLRKALYSTTEREELALLETKATPSVFPICRMLPAPLSQKSRYTNIHVPSMRRFVTDSGKLAKLDQLLIKLKDGGHRVLLYFQMTRMIDLMEEYLTYRNYKYLRLDGSTKLEDRRDTVADFQTKPEIFIFLLSTRAGGLGINLTAADTVIFYDSDWNPTIDSQAMDRAHRLGQTRQVTVYRMITRNTIEERIRKRALQKEEVQRVVIQGGSGAGVDFNTRSKENRAKDMAMWLADDDQAEMIERKEQEAAAKGDLDGKKGRKKTAPRKRDINLDDMYHEGEGHFDDGSNKPSGAATPIEPPDPVPGKRKGVSKKAKTAKQRLAIADGSGA